MKHAVYLLTALIGIGAFGSPSTPRAAPAAQWRIDILPELVTPVGTLPSVNGRDLNEVGQVSGTAHDPEHIAAFRYTPGLGMEDLDPDGRYRSGVRNGGSINDHGDVLLFSGDNDREMDLFLYTDENGHRSLRRGKNRRVRTSFRLFPGTSGIPNSGHLCGFVIRPSGGLEPYIFRPGSGWESLRSAHPRFRSSDAVCKYTNERGDIVFAVAKAGGEQEAFVSVNGERPIELPCFARNVNVTGEINASGVVPGLYLDHRGRERAYVWSPDQGLIELPRQRRLRLAAALFATADSVVWGLLAKKGQRPDTIFSWTEADGLRIRVRRPRLRRLARRHGLRFEQAGISSVNDHGAIVGDIRTDSETSSLPYYFSAETGLVDLARVVADLGVSFVPATAQEVNNRGQVLLRGRVVEPSTRTATAVLSLIGD